MTRIYADKKSIYPRPSAQSAVICPLLGEFAQGGGRKGDTLHCSSGLRLLKSVKIVLNLTSASSVESWTNSLIAAQWRWGCFRGLSALGGCGYRLGQRNREAAAPAAGLRPGAARATGSATAARLCAIVQNVHCGGLNGMGEPQRYGANRVGQTSTSSDLITMISMSILRTYTDEDSNPTG